MLSSASWAGCFASKAFQLRFAPRTQRTKSEVQLLTPHRTQSRPRSADKSRKRFMEDLANERTRFRSNKTIHHLGPADAQRSIATQMRLRRHARSDGQM